MTTQFSKPFPIGSPNKSLFIETFEFSRKELEESTRENYEQRLKPLERFCKEIDEKYPPSEWVLAAYLKKLSDARLSQSTIRGIQSAVRDLFRHDLNNNPTDASIVKSVSKAAAKVAPPPRRRDPLLRRHLWAMWHHHNLMVSGKPEIRARRTFSRDFAMILLAYRGLLRGSEVVGIRKEELWFETVSEETVKDGSFPRALLGRTVIYVFINSSKTRPQKQLPLAERRGDVVLIVEDGDGRLDPVLWVRAWIGNRDKENEFFFHSFNPNKSEISRKSFSETVRDLASKSGISDHVKLTSHSMRAGGATDAIKRHVDLRLVKRHGRWKSDAVFLYIKDDHAAGIAVSAALGSASGAGVQSKSAVDDSVYCKPGSAQAARTLLAARQDTPSAAVATAGTFQESSTVRSFYGH